MKALPQNQADELIARRRSVYPDRDELRLLKEARESGLFFDVTRGRLERALRQKELAEQVQGQNAARRRRLQRERTFNRELQLMRARSEVEMARLPGLQAAAVRPVDDDDYVSVVSDEDALAPRPAFLPPGPAADAVPRRPVFLPTGGSAPDPLAPDPLAPRSTPVRPTPVARPTAMRLVRELMTNMKRTGQSLTERERHERIRKIATTRDSLDNRFQREDLERLFLAASTPYERRQAGVA